jgi:peptide chain release factor 2
MSNYPRWGISGYNDSDGREIIAFLLKLINKQCYRLSKQEILGAEVAEFHEIQERANKLNAAVAEMWQSLDVAARLAEIDRLEAKTTEDNFWGDPTAANKLLAEMSRKKREIEPWRELHKRVEDLATLAELAAEEQDEASAQEAVRGIGQAEKDLERLETQALLSGEYASHNALLSINAGAGGTESCDWAAMLGRMYLRWAESRGFPAEVIDTVPGEQAGVKSMTISIEGPFAYGYLEGERGVHRLVRISPFDANARRHTSFASVDVLPEVEQTDEVNVPQEELRVDTFRASSAGGQHMQKNETAVRITHIPTGIVVSCQNERSQQRNRMSAMKVLLARLLEVKRREQDAKMQQLRGEHTDIAWGNQIRSYVLQPYTMVKDNRTNAEVGNALAVLDGELDTFLEAYLRWHAQKK